MIAVTSGRLAAAAACAALVAGVATLAQPDGQSAVAIDGRALFVSKGCSACHASAERSSVFGVGPSLSQAAVWAPTRVEGMSAKEYIAQSITSPWMFISPAWAGPNGPATHMPALALTGDEVEALVTYLLGSPPEGQG